MADVTRYCDCGCGASLNGSPQQRWATDVAKGAGRAEAAHVRGRSSDGAGVRRVRAGLEQWLIDQPALPEVTVERRGYWRTSSMPTPARESSLGALSGDPRTAHGAGGAAAHDLR